MSSMANDQPKHFTEDELLTHPLANSIIFSIRTFCTMAHMLVPPAVSAMIDRYVGHALCQVTAYPASKKCPITKTYYHDAHCQKLHFKKIKKLIKQLKKNKKKVKEPKLKFPAQLNGPHWKEFVNPKNHTPGLFDAITECCVGDGLYNFSSDALKKIDLIDRPEHSARMAQQHGGDAMEQAGRNMRQLIVHGCKHEKLMALICWYSMEYSKPWCMGHLQRGATVEEVKACGYTGVKMTPYKRKMRYNGQCHMNAVEMFLENDSKGSVCVGYAAYMIPILGIYTIMLEAHSVWYHNGTYYCSTIETVRKINRDTGTEENYTIYLAKDVTFIPCRYLKMNEIDQHQQANLLINEPLYKNENSLKEAKKALKDATMHRNEHEDMVRRFAGSNYGNVLMMGNEDVNRTVKQELAFFYKLAATTNDEKLLQPMRLMWEQLDWLVTPLDVEVKDSSVHGKGLFSLRNVKPGDVVYTEPKKHLIQDLAHVLDKNKQTIKDISHVWSFLFHRVDQSPAMGWLKELACNPKMTDSDTATDKMMFERLYAFLTKDVSPDRRTPLPDMELFKKLYATLLTNHYKTKVPEEWIYMQEDYIPEMLWHLVYVGRYLSRINHGPPNVLLKPKFARSKNSEAIIIEGVEVVATHGIEAGDELFIDYGPSYVYLMSKKTMDNNNHVSHGQGGNGHKDQQREDDSASNGNQQMNNNSETVKKIVKEQIYQLVREAATKAWHYHGNYDLESLPTVSNRVDVSLYDKLKRHLDATEVALVEQVRLRLQDEQPPCKKQKPNVEDSETEFKAAVKFAMENPVLEVRTERSICSQTRGRLDGRDLTRDEVRYIQLQLHKFNGTKIPTHLFTKADKIKFYAYLRIWYNVSTIPFVNREDGSMRSNEGSHHIYCRSYMLTLAMDFTDEMVDESLELADKLFDDLADTHDSNEMLKYIKNGMFDLLEQFYLSYMNCSDTAREKIMKHWRDHFLHTEVHESMIAFRKAEIKDDFCCEDEKKKVAKGIQKLNEIDPNWRAKADCDWRVKELKEENEDPE
tara:strand:+ start:1946 stop:5038 length:3093 start_codon:yes stop_codon:yes gene_type:complete